MEDSSDSSGSSSSATGGNAEAMVAWSTSTLEKDSLPSKPEDEPFDYGCYIEEEQPPQQIQDEKDQNA